MCKMNVREGTESFETIGTVVLRDIAKTLEGGKKSPLPPPPGRGLKHDTRNLRQQSDQVTRHVRNYATMRGSTRGCQVHITNSQNCFT